MKKSAKLKLAVLLCILLFAVCACAKKDDTSGKTPDKTTEEKDKKNTPKPTEAASDGEDEDGEASDEEDENKPQGEPFDVEGYLAKADELAKQIAKDDFNGKFIYDGTMFQLPCTEQDILDAGFSVSSDDVEAARKIPANSTRGVYFEKAYEWIEPDGTEQYHWFGFWCHFRNYSDSERDISSLKGIGINLATPNDVGDFSRFLLPKGIEYRVSTVQDVLDAYGTPTTLKAWSDTETYMEYDGDYFHIEFHFTPYLGSAEYRDYTTEEQVLTQIIFYRK